jgi:formiminotetrahydrofolate cyclodeaminase
VEFSEALASKAPVPGGGGASALTGALGAALGSMVCNLTIGKKAYKAVEEDVRAILSSTERVRQRMLALVDEDAVVFEPLAKAYGIKAETPVETAKKQELMETCLKQAATVPEAIVREALACLELLEALAGKGSRLAISDVAVGAALCSAALEGGRFNVVINTSLMKDREYADRLDSEVDGLVTRGRALAERIVGLVEQRIKKS